MRIFKIAYLMTVFVILPMTAFAVEKCATPDKSFDNFLQKFESDVAFQRSRLILPLVARFGDYMMSNVVIELWTIDKIKALDYPLVLTDEGKRKEVVKETTLLNTPRYVEVYHEGPPESDSYRVLYKFRNIEGCWFLEEMHDKSL